MIGSPKIKNAISYLINGKKACKKLFERTYVSAEVLARLVKKEINSDGVIKNIDERGKHDKQVIISETVTEDLKTFFAKLPKYTSYYGCEKSTNVLTLAPSVTKSELWKEFLSDKNYTVSLKWFNKYWHKNLPVKLYNNHVDTCDICNDNTLSKEVKQKHQDEAYMGRQAMKDDPVTLTFDLQKAYVIPGNTTNKAYYKAGTYNKGLHDSAINQGYAHLWRENIVKCGSREISSVVYRFVKNHCKEKERLCRLASVVVRTRINILHWP